MEGLGWDVSMHFPWFEAGERVHEGYQGHWGWIKRCRARCWVGDGGGSEVTLVRVYCGVAAPCLSYSRRSVGSASSITAVHQNKPLGPRWKEPDFNPRCNINLSSQLLKAAAELISSRDAAWLSHLCWINAVESCQLVPPHCLPEMASWQHFLMRSWDSFVCATVLDQRRQGSPVVSNQADTQL